MMTPMCLFDLKQRLDGEAALVLGVEDVRQ